MESRIILFHKPYGVLSQFSREGTWESLADYGPFPKAVYPAGRLDADSEGLLLLTDDNRIKHRLTDPQHQHPRTYLVQVERLPDPKALELLRKGVRVEGKKTKPADVELLREEPPVLPRRVPIRRRKNIPTAWLRVTLKEGRNRQVRKMTAAAGHPTLRLIRVAVGALTLDGVLPGKSRELNREEIQRLRRELRIDYSSPSAGSSPRGASGGRGARG
jgi:23S rRNA pseudouridine2457 synthase